MDTSVDELLKDMNTILSPNLPEEVLALEEKQAVKVNEKLRELEETALDLIDRIDERNQRIMELQEILATQGRFASVQLESELAKVKKELDKYEKQLKDVQNLTQYLPFLHYLKILQTGAEQSDSVYRPLAKGLWANEVLGGKEELSNMEQVVKRIQDVTTGSDSFIGKALDELKKIQERIRLRAEFDKKSAGLRRLGAEVKTEFPNDTQEINGVLESLKKDKLKYIDELYQTMNVYALPLGVARLLYDLKLPSPPVSEIVAILQGWARREAKYEAYVQYWAEDQEARFKDSPIFKVTLPPTGNQIEAFVETLTGEKLLEEVKKRLQVPAKPPELAKPPEAPALGTLRTPQVGETGEGPPGLPRAFSKKFSDLVTPLSGRATPPSPPPPSPPPAFPPASGPKPRQNRKKQNKDKNQNKAYSDANIRRLLTAWMQ